MPLKSKPRRSPTGASSKDIALIARNAKHATQLMQLQKDVRHSPNTFKALHFIKERPRTGIFVGDRGKWHVTAMRDRMTIETIGRNTGEEIDRDLAKLRRQCDARKKELTSQKRRLPRTSK